MLPRGTLAGMDLPRGPAYRLETERLVLRCWQPGDAELLKACIDANLEHLRPWMPWALDEPTDLETKRSFCRRSRGRFDLEVDFIYGVFDAAEREVLGGSGLHDRVGAGALEIGYWISRARGGEGLATEAAAALTVAGFEVFGRERIEIRCAPENRASAKVAQKLGYRHEVTRRQLDRDVQGRPRDTMIWTLLREEYPESPAARAEVVARDIAGAAFPRTP